MNVVRSSVDHTAMLLKPCLRIHSSPIIYTVVVPTLIASSLPLYYTFLYTHVVCHACIIAFVYGSVNSYTIVGSSRSNHGSAFGDRDSLPCSA
jgi:hypothetical protein